MCVLSFCASYHHHIMSYHHRIMCLLRGLQSMEEIEAGVCDRGRCSSAVCCMELTGVEGAEGSKGLCGRPRGQTQCTLQVEHAIWRLVQVCILCLLKPKPTQECLQHSTASGRVICCCHCSEYVQLDSPGPASIETTCDSLCVRSSEVRMHSVSET